jgi:hypothetical protein
VGRKGRNEGKKEKGEKSFIVSCPKHGVAEIFALLLSVPAGCQNIFYHLHLSATWLLPVG